MYADRSPDKYATAPFKFSPVPIRPSGVCISYCFTNERG